MSKPSCKSFDCVQSMRQIRDRLSAEITDMNYDELASGSGRINTQTPFCNGWLIGLANKPMQRTGLRPAADRQDVGLH